MEWPQKQIYAPYILKNNTRIAGQVKTVSIKEVKLTDSIFIKNFLLIEKKKATESGILQSYSQSTWLRQESHQEEHFQVQIPVSENSKQWLKINIQIQ